jgi:hypothetical protein
MLYSRGQLIGHHHYDVDGLSTPPRPVYPTIVLRVILWASISIIGSLLHPQKWHDGFQKLLMTPLPSYPLISIAVCSMRGFWHMTVSQSVQGLAGVYGIL